MSISFIRVDDRMIHGQTCTRWALEYPCDGLIAVNDKAAKTPVLKAAYKNASDKKTFVWSLDEWAPSAARCWRAAFGQCFGCFYEKCRKSRCNIVQYIGRHLLKTGLY